MESFAAIPIFVTVVETGGFSPAAKQLGISKSAVSKRVTQLEEQLGAKLLHRTTRKLSLTEAGEHYFQHARMAHQAAKDAKDAVDQLQGEPQGRLRINAPMSFGRLHLAPLIPEFLKRYPKINIDLVMEDKVSDLIGDGFDIAIRGGNLSSSSLVARKLAPLKNILCVSPEYIKHHGKPTQLEELHEHNCLIFTHSHDVKEWIFIKAGQTYAIEVTGNYQVNNSEALKEAILQGVGIGRLPTFVAGQELKKGKLIALFEDYRMPDKSINAVFPERQYMPTKVRAFIDFAIEYFGGDTPYWDN
jgi:DNA-binding transcriptional LysR family regulator